MGVSFILSAWFLWGNGSRQTYIPGSEVEGLTKRLDREIPEDFVPVTFRNVTNSSGIHFSHFNQVRTSKIAEDMGSGAAWADFNNDGWDDLFIVNYAAPLNREMEKETPGKNRCALYLNNGDGSFRDVSQHAGVDIPLRGMGVAAADYDNDGWTDILVTAYGDNILLKNNGDTTFTDVSGPAGISGIDGFWAGASWGDYDRDGDLDLYIAGYVKYIDFSLSESDLATEEPPSINPSTFKPERNLFYRNNGDGSFTEIAREIGVDNENGRSLSASWVDVNNDRWPDLYVANDVSDNVLFVNKRDGTFESASHSAHVADYRGAMGIASGDWDNDQDTDLFITHWIAQENALFTNEWNDSLRDTGTQRLQFKDVSAVYGLGQSSLDYIGWATSFVDIDLDGRLDLYVVNGSTFQTPGNRAELRPMKDRLYWNGDKKRGFFDVSSSAGPYFKQEFVGRGGAYSDYDRDGDVDLFIVNHSGPGILLKNENELGNNWLTVRLEGRQSNRSAIGATIRLSAGEDLQLRQVGSQSTYLSQNTLVQYFGLGKHRRVDTLEVAWPSGKTAYYIEVPVNRHIKITEGAAELAINPESP